MRLLVDPFPSGPLVLDASVIFNLLGCEHPNQVLGALDVVCLIEERTLREIKRHPIAGVSHTDALSSLQHDGHIRIHRMSAIEYDVYLGLVSGIPAESLGDGESAAIATAIGTKYSIILDDGKARKICRSRFPQLNYFSSLRMFLEASVRAGWDDEKLRSLVRAARLNARMNVVKGEEALLSSLDL